MHQFRGGHPVDGKERRSVARGRVVEYGNRAVIHGTSLIPCSPDARREARSGGRPQRRPSVAEQSLRSTAACRVPPRSVMVR